MSGGWFQKFLDIVQTPLYGQVGIGKKLAAETQRVADSAKSGGASFMDRPGLAAKAIAEMLQIRKGSAVLMLEGTTYSRNGEPVEHLEGVYRGDRYQMKVNILR